jgi:hypothetical protein
MAGQRAAAARVLEEERLRTPEVKVAQLARLMRSIDACGLGPGLSAGDDLIRERWQKLRRRLGAKT